MKLLQTNIVKIHRVREAIFGKEGLGGAKTKYKCLGEHLLEKYGKREDQQCMEFVKI